MDAPLPNGGLVHANPSVKKAKKDNLSIPCAYRILTSFHISPPKSPDALNRNSRHIDALLQLTLWVVVVFHRYEQNCRCL